MKKEAKKEKKEEKKAKYLDEDTLKEIGLRCLHIREDYNKDRILSQREFAKKLKISHSDISQIERGEAEMSLKTLHAYQKATGYSYDYFMGKAECKDADNEEIHKRLGLTEEAIEFLTTLVKRKKFEGENIKVSYFIIKTINFLLEQEDNVSFLSALSDFLWHEYKTGNTDGCDVVMLEDLAGVQHSFSLSEMNNIKILEIQQLLPLLKDIAEAKKLWKITKIKKAGNIFCTSDQTAQKIIPLENQEWFPIFNYSTKNHSCK